MSANATDVMFFSTAWVAAVVAIIIKFSWLIFDFFIFPFFGSFLCLNRLGFTDASGGLTNKLFSTLFLENYSFAERKNFTRNALQSGEIKRGSPNLRLENQPAMAGMKPDER